MSIICSLKHIGMLNDSPTSPQRQEKWKYKWKGLVASHKSSSPSLECIVSSFIKQPYNFHTTQRPWTLTRSVHLCCINETLAACYPETGSWMTAWAKVENLGTVQLVLANPLMSENSHSWEFWFTVCIERLIQWSQTTATWCVSISSMFLTDRSKNVTQLPTLLLTCRL